MLDVDVKDFLKELWLVYNLMKDDEEKIWLIVKVFIDNVEVECICLVWRVL